MKISVVIPTYNSAKVIGATLESVFRQTVPPDEILVMDDGSTDDTMALLSSHTSRITILQQANQGVAPTRNTLSQRATGDLIAFLDHDDLWHPRYLEMQSRRFKEYPQAAAFFSGHMDITDSSNFAWHSDDDELEFKAEVIDPLNFLLQYNKSTGLFGSMSFCSVPKRVLMEMGQEPFRVSGVDDSYFCTVLPLVGSVVYTATPLVAYRVMREGQSANRLKSMGLWLNVFELLDDRYRRTSDPQLQAAFRLAFALKRRRYGKLLMGSDRTPEAREQFWDALAISESCASKLKSLALWFLTWLPSQLQPTWPSGDRETGDTTMNFHRSRRPHVSKS
jgi:hypothetical protein